MRLRPLHNFPWYIPPVESPGAAGVQGGAARGGQGHRRTPHRRARGGERPAVGRRTGRRAGAAGRRAGGDGPHRLHRRQGRDTYAVAGRQVSALIIIFTPYNPLSSAVIMMSMTLACAVLAVVCLVVGISGSHLSRTLGESWTSGTCNCATPGAVTSGCGIHRPPRFHTIMQTAGALAIPFAAGTWKQRCCSVAPGLIVPSSMCGAQGVCAAGAPQ